MTYKLRCTVTGNIIYMTEKRYTKLLSKFGNEENLKANFVSMYGKKIREGSQEIPDKITNRIKCTVTNRWCYITNERIAAGIAKKGSWEKLCESYICRPAKRLMKAGKTVDDIRQMIKDGTFPEK
jgi:hypothetical protein